MKNALNWIICADSGRLCDFRNTKDGPEAKDGPEVKPEAIKEAKLGPEDRR